MFGEVEESSKEPLRTALHELMQPNEVDEHKIDLDVHVKTREFWLCSMNHCDDEGYPCVQLFLEEDVAHMYLGSNIPDDHQAVMNIYATATKTTVIKRDTVILTKDEEKTHWKELQEAMLEELKIWVKDNCSI